MKRIVVYSLTARRIPKECLESVVKFINASDPKT